MAESLTRWSLRDPFQPKLFSDSTGITPFLVFNWIFLLFNLCMLPPVFLLHVTEKSLASTSLFPTIKYWYTLTKSRWTLSSLGKTLKSFLVQHMLQSLNHVSGPSLCSLQYIHASCTVEPGTGNSTPDVSLVLGRREISTM